jgi:hypothetical protein
VLQSTANVSFTVPAGTLVPHGGHLIIARNATKAAFQTFYGKTHGTNVVYINSAAVSATQFPRISGAETFTLSDSQLVTVEGPTIAEPAGGLRTFQRLDCGTAAGAVSSWQSSASSVATASPGSGILSTGQNRVCISEIADVATGASNGFEYLEIFVE